MSSDIPILTTCSEPNQMGKRVVRDLQVTVRASSLTLDIEEDHGDPVTSTNITFDLKDSEHLSSLKNFIDLLNHQYRVYAEGLCQAEHPTFENDCPTKDIIENLKGEQKNGL